MLKNPDCEKIFPHIYIIYIYMYLYIYIYIRIVCSQMINMSQIIIDVSIHLYIHLYIYISYGWNPPKSKKSGKKRSTQKNFHPPCSRWGSSRYRSTSSGWTCRNRCGHRSWWSGWSVGSGVRDWYIIYVIYSITVYIYIYVFFYVYIYICHVLIYLIV